MSSKLKRLAGDLACLALLSSPCLDLSAQSLPQAVSVPSGSAVVLRIPNLKRVLVGDGKLLSVKSLPNGELILAGRQRGKTSLILWTRSGENRTLEVTVRGPDVDQINDEVRRTLGPESTIRVDALGDQLILTGDVRNELEADKLRLLTEKDARMVSLVKSHGREEMIALEVRFLEVKKSALENIGINWQKTLNGPMLGVVGDFKTNRNFRPSSTGIVENGVPNFTGNFPGTTDGLAVLPPVSPFSIYFGLQTALLSVINLMEQKGDAIVLAEPILSCRSGGTAKFLAGGEIPLPVSTGFGATSVQFKPYGIRFEVKPKLTDAGSISASILTELSTVDPAVKVGDFPGFLSRMTETQVNLKLGETLVMSGLISEEGSKSIDQLSGLGDLPILGALFRSKDFREKRSEMVVFITPRLITPAGELNQKLMQRASEALGQSRSTISGRANDSVPTQPSDDQPVGAQP